MAHDPILQRPLGSGSRHLPASRQVDPEVWLCTCQRQLPGHEVTTYLGYDVYLLGAEAGTADDQGHAEDSNDRVALHNRSGLGSMLDLWRQRTAASTYQISTRVAVLETMGAFVGPLCSLSAKPSDEVCVCRLAVILTGRHLTRGEAI